MIGSTPWLRLAVVVVATTALAPFASAQPDFSHCSNVCTESTPRDTACRTQTGPEQIDEVWSTCGEWGVCEPGPCVPDWEQIDAESMGGFTLKFWTFPLKCEFYGTYLITERDMNQCGEPDRTWCFWRLEATRSDHRCCEFYRCSPNACHQP